MGFGDRPLDRHFDRLGNSEPQLAENRGVGRVRLGDPRASGVERAVHRAMGIGTNDQLARTHVTVVAHHLVADTGFRVVKIFDSQARGHISRDFVAARLQLGGRRLVMIGHHVYSLNVPEPRQSARQSGFDGFGIDLRNRGGKQQPVDSDADVIAGVQFAPFHRFLREDFFRDGFAHGFAFVPNRL